MKTLSKYFNFPIQLLFDKEKRRGFFSLSVFPLIDDTKLRGWFMHEKVDKYGWPITVKNILSFNHSAFTFKALPYESDLVVACRM